MKTAAALLLTLAIGCTQNPLQRCGPWTTVVNNLALTSARSWTHDGSEWENWGIATVVANLTGQSGCTRVDMACSSTPDEGTTYAPLSECAVSSGVCTVSDASWAKTVAAADVWTMRVDVEGIDDWKCTLSCGAGVAAAGDLITAYQRVCTKG